MKNSQNYITSFQCFVLLNIPRQLLPSPLLRGSNILDMFFIILQIFQQIFALPGVHYLML